MQAKNSVKDFFKRAPTIILMVFLVIFAVDIVELSLQGDMTGFPWLLVPIVPLACYWAYWTQKAPIEHFANWLKTNIPRLEKEIGIEYGIVRITKETELVEFKTVVSIVLFTFTFPSGKMLPEIHSTKFFMALSCIVTFVFGWWGFPWGPIKTVPALITNLRGGKRYKVQDFLFEEKREVV